MVILRDDDRVARMAKIGQYVSFLSMAILLGGLALIFLGDENAIFFQLHRSGSRLGSVAGWALPAASIHARTPCGQVLDDALKHVARDGRLYHFALPAPHVLLLPTGVVILHTKYQKGEIYAEGDNWTQKGVGMRKYFGQEGLGNPSKEAEKLISSMANYIRKNAPDIEEVPMAPIIVFTSKDIESLDVKNSRIPAMHASKLKGLSPPAERQIASDARRKNMTPYEPPLIKKVANVTEEEDADTA